MSLFKRGSIWWYEFWFAGRRVRESAKTGSKTVAKGAEQTRRRELEEGFNNLEDVRQDRIRTIAEISDEYLTSYRLRNARSAVFAEYAIGHVKRLVGDQMLVDVNEQTIKGRTSGISNPSVRLYFRLFSYGYLYRKIEYACFHFFP